MNKSSSFIQDQKHSTKSARFQAVKPELVETVLAQRGFKLVDLKTGHARDPERAHHQTTIARYRSQSEFKVGGLHLDIVAKMPHLYGSIELILGTYRVICTNGLVVGEAFESFKIKHLGNPIQELNNALTQLVAQEAQLIETIQRMQDTQLDVGQMRDFSRAVGLKLVGETSTNADVHITDQALLVPYREEDKATDLFTVLNVVQENALRSKMPYLRVSRKLDGTLQYRNLKTRGAKDSSAKAIEVNKMIWDIGSQFLEVA